MLNRNEHRILTALAAVALVLVLANMVLFTQNRQAQVEVASRAQFIQQVAQLEPLYREIVKALADLSVRNNDDQLRDVLARQGISIAQNPGQVPEVTMSPGIDTKRGGN